MFIPHKIVQKYCFFRMLIFFSEIPGRLKKSIKIVGEGGRIPRVAGALKTQMSLHDFADAPVAY